MKCAVKSDLTALIKEGDASPLVLNDLWLKIFLEFLDATGDNKLRYRLGLVNEMTVLSGRIQIVDSALFGLQQVYTSRLTEDLIRIEVLEEGDIDLPELVFVKDMDPETQESYYETLNMIKTRAAEFGIDLKLKQVELEELDENEAKEEKQELTNAYFLNILSRIATYKRVAVIRTSEIMTAEFCSMFTEYLDYVNRVNNHKKPPTE